jgi:hypothetical protein
VRAVGLERHSGTDSDSIFPNNELGAPFAIATLERTMTVLEDMATLAEVQGDRVDAAALGDAITSSGAIIVRKLVSAADVRALDDAFQKALNACQAGVRGDWFTPYDDGTQTLAYTRALRRTLGNKVYTDNWRQDGAFLGRDTKVLNVWLALTACGERAASVQIGLSRQSGLVPVGGEGALFDWTVSPKRPPKPRRPARFRCARRAMRCYSITCACIAPRSTRPTPKSAVRSRPGFSHRPLIRAVSTRGLSTFSVKVRPGVPHRRWQQPRRSRARNAGQRRVLY